jgi:hypothetical protein
MPNGGEASYPGGSNIMNRKHLKLVEPRTEAAATSMLSLRAAASDKTANTSMVAADEFVDGWSEKVCNRFEEMGKLQLGWDGYSAAPIGKSTMNFALLLLGNVLNEARALAFPSINPMSNGSIMIEWRTLTQEITVEVNNTNDVDVLIESLPTEAVEEFHVTSDFSRISDALEQSTRPVHAVA